MASNQANQADNAILARRLQVVEQGVAGTPIGSSSRIYGLTPQAPPSGSLNPTEVAPPVDSGSSKRMRVRESGALMVASDGQLNRLQQADTDLLAAIQRGDEPTDESQQVTCDSTEHPTASPTKRPVVEPEPTNITPFSKDDHDDGGGPWRYGQDDSLRGTQIGWQTGKFGKFVSNRDKPTQSGMSKGGNGHRLSHDNKLANEMISAYEFGDVNVLNRSGVNPPEKLPTTSFGTPTPVGGGSVGGNDGPDGDGGNGGSGDSHNGSNGSSDSSHGNRKSAGDPDGSGGDSGGGNSDPPRNVWESIPGENGMRRFLALLEAQLVKEKWSKIHIWRALVHVKDQWVFPRSVDAALWNIEHSSQASQLTNRLQSVNGSFKVQLAVDSALKEKVVKDAFTITAEMLASRRKKALSPKLMMRLMALLDDMNGSVHVGNFRSTIAGLTSMLKNANMCPLTLVQFDKEKETTTPHGIDINFEVPDGLKEELLIGGVNDTDKTAKVMYGAMGKALDDWVSASVGASGLVMTSGMSYLVRKGYLAPEVCRLVEMYRNTTLMIAHIIHRLVVKASQLASKVNKPFLHRLARKIQVAYLTAETYKCPVKCSIQSTDAMSLLLRTPNIGSHAMFEMLSALTDARNVGNYVEAVQLLSTPSHIPTTFTAHEGLVQIHQACSEAVGPEAKLLRKTGAMPLLFMVWMEGVQSSQHLTPESDKFLTQLQESYREQVRRMTSIPSTHAQNLTFSENRDGIVRALLEDLECSSPSGAVNVLTDAKVCTSVGTGEPTAEEIIAMLLESLCRILKNRLDFEKMYRIHMCDAYDAALVFDPTHESREREPGSTTERTAMMTEDDLLAFVASMRDVSIGEGDAPVKSIDSVLHTANVEAENPFCPPEERPVGFGAVGSTKRNGGESVDANIAHILLETAVNERYFTAHHPVGIPAPVLSLGRIYIMARKHKWLDTTQRTKPGDPPPLFNPPPLTLEESFDLPEMERAIYYALYRHVGTKWNSVVMGKFETLTMGYRDTVRQCKVDGNVRKMAQVAWENYGIDDESIVDTPHAALAAQMESQQLEISSLRAEMAAQADAKNAEAVAVEQAAIEKVKAQELRVSGAVDFLLNTGSGHSRAEAAEAVRESLSLP